MRNRPRCNALIPARTLTLVLWLALVSLAGSVAAETTDAEERIVDRVVAVVGSAGERGADARIVTAFELEVEARLVLAERARSIESASHRVLSDRLLEAVLETIVNHLLIEGEAERLELVSLDDEDVLAERRAIEQRVGAEGSLEGLRESLGAPVELIDAIVRRRALVAIFIRNNVQLTVTVTDEDVDGVYRSGDHPFGDRPLEEVRDALEALVVARRHRERLARWLSDARSRSWVRIIPR